MIRDLGGEIEQVVVNDIVDDTFYAILRVKNGARAIAYDTRPSDAIALSVHSGAPIFAAPEVLDKAGIKFDPETGSVLPSSGADGASAEEQGESHISEAFLRIERAMSGSWHIIGATEA